MKFKGTTTGFSEFDKLLKQLPKKTENKILLRATRETLSEVVLKPLKVAAPRHEGKRSAASQKFGTLLSNIRVKQLRKSRKNERTSAVHTGRGFWGYIIEKGSRYIPANPWFFPTFNALRRSMIQTLGEKIGRGIETEAEKSYRGGRR